MNEFNERLKVTTKSVYLSSETTFCGEEIDPREAIAFDTRKYAIVEYKGSNTITIKGVRCIIDRIIVKMVDFIGKREILFFISVVEAFLANRLSGIESKYFSFTPKEKGGTLLNIHWNGKTITLNKFECTEIMNCWRALTKECSVYSAWEGITQDIRKAIDKETLKEWDREL